MAVFDVKKGSVRIWGLRQYSVGSKVRIELTKTTDDIIIQLEELTELGFLVPRSFEQAEKDKGFKERFEESLNKSIKNKKKEAEDYKKYIEDIKSTGDEDEDNQKLTITPLTALKGGIKRNGKKIRNKK